MARKLLVKSLAVKGQDSYAGSSSLQAYRGFLKL